MNFRLIQHAGRILATLALTLVYVGAAQAQTIGGSGGAIWVDELKKCSGKTVNGIKVRAGNRVDGLQFGYKGGGWAPARGATGGNSIDISLPDGETFVEIRYRAGSAIDQISFVTNKGKVYGPYGGNGGAAGVYRVPAGAGLGCMQGRADSSILQLQFGAATISPPKTGGGNWLSDVANCSGGTAPSGGGSVSGGNVQGGGSAGGGFVCTNTVGYGNPSGYVNVTLSCQSGMFASAEGQAGANGVAVCADASVGTSCTTTLGAGGSNKYGGGSGTAGVSGGNAEGAGACGGVTFTNEAIAISMCGSLAFQVGIDVCINGTVNYKNVYNSVEPFASRAVAQAAKCASTSSNTNCAFTVGDLLANAAAPFVGRTQAFFDTNYRFRTDAARDVWNEAKAGTFRSGNYSKAVNKFIGNELKNTTYNAVGQVVNSSNQVMDLGKSSVNAATKFSKSVGNDINKGLGKIGI